MLTRGGETVALGSKVSNLPVHRGDRLLLQTSGGGGRGVPEDRDPRDAARDRRLGY